MRPAPDSPLTTQPSLNYIAARLSEAIRTKPEAANALARAIITVGADQTWTPEVTGTAIAHLATITDAADLPEPFGNQAPDYYAPLASNNRPSVDTITARDNQPDSSVWRYGQNENSPNAAVEFDR
jgi:hypothetical protein